MKYDYEFNLQHHPSPELPPAVAWLLQMIGYRNWGVTMRPREFSQFCEDLRRTTGFEIINARRQPHVGSLAMRRLARDGRNKWRPTRDKPTTEKP